MSGISLPDPTVDGVGGCTADIYNSLAGSFTGPQAVAMCEAMAGFLAADSDAIVGLTEGLNCLYLVLCAALVFVMHAGFAMLCAGAIRSKNTMNILLQTILDATVSAIAFYVCGYAFAYGSFSESGPPPNGFIGNSLFGLSKFETENPNPGHWQDWVFQWAFAATATTIPAGCVAERFNFNAYLGYSFFISAFVYPVVVHWAWSGYGWMAYGRLHNAPGGHLFKAGYIDFAGSGVVHMVGGFSGFCGCVLVGPRMGRFDSNGKPVDMPGHSATLVVLGTVLLWFGWYGFNPGSMIFINSVNYAQVVGRAAVTTTLSGAAGGLSALALTFLQHKSWDLIQVCNGVLCGFVAITAGAHVLEPWAAIIAGALAAIIFDGVCKLFLKLRIDDPLCACPMHGFCGIWGVLFVGLLAKQQYVWQVYSGTHLTTGPDGEQFDDPQNYPYGLFYPGGGGRLLACQVIGVLVIVGWVCAMMIPFFFAFKLLGALRISPEDEQAGLDVSKHGGSAYNYDHGLGKPDKSAVSPNTAVSLAAAR